MMVKVITGGHLSETTRSVYKQVRLLSTADQDTLEQVHQIFQEKNSDVPKTANIIGDEGAPVPLGNNEFTYLSTIKRDYETLRRSYNRLFFLESNPLLFDRDTLQLARDEFEHAKEHLSFDSQNAAFATIMRRVEIYLANNRKLVRPDCSFFIYFFGFIFWLSGAIVLIVLSGMDGYCIEALDKRMDYKLSLKKYPVMTYCLPRNRDAADAVLNNDALSIANHLADLTARSTTLFNFGLLIASILIGKVVTNFTMGKPGFAGIRFSCPELKLFGIKIGPRIRHREVDSPYDAQYHVERYLDRQGIFLDILEYKFDDIEDLVDKCRYSGDLEYCVAENGISLSVMKTPQTHHTESRFSGSNYSPGPIDGATGLLTPATLETPLKTPPQSKGFPSLEMEDRSTAPSYSRKLLYNADPERSSTMHGAMDSEDTSDSQQTLRPDGLMTGQMQNIGIEMKSFTECNTNSIE